MTLSMLCHTTIWPAGSVAGFGEKDCAPFSRTTLIVTTPLDGVGVGAGVGVGVIAALVAIAPALAERGGRLPVNAGGVVLVFAVVATGLLSTVVAIRVATRGSLLSSLRSD